MIPVDQGSWPGAEDTRPRHWVTVGSVTSQEDVTVAYILDSGTEDPGVVPQTWILSWLEWATLGPQYGFSLDGTPNPLYAAWQTLRGAATDPVVNAVYRILQANVPEVGQPLPAS